MARNANQSPETDDITIDETDSMDLNPPIHLVVLGIPVTQRWNDFPLVNRVNVFKRQLKHILGNEPAAEVGIKVDELLALPEGTSDDDVKTARANFREQRKDEYSALVQAAIDKRLDILLRGEISADDRQRVDPVQRMYLSLVDGHVAAQLKGAKGADGKALKAPTNDKDVLVFGNGMTRTRQQMRDAMIAREGHEALMEQARIAVEAAKVKTTVTAPVEPVNDPAALGF